MKRIAPDIDQLMWTLAEARDMDAVAEFEKRFPELRLELAKRVALVGGLRGARFEEGRPAPRFQPSSPPASIWGKPLVLAGAFAGLLVLAWGGYAGTRALLASRASAPPPVEAPTDTFEPSVEKRQDPAPVAVAPPQAPATAVPPPQSVPAYLQPLSIRIEDAPLHTVLSAIASQSGLSLEIAPGMPNFTVSVAYDHEPGVRMLQDLGRRYGFSVLGQGGSRVLLVPVVDTASPADQPTGLPGTAPSDRG